VALERGMRKHIIDQMRKKVREEDEGKIEEFELATVCDRAAACLFLAVQCDG
jgi:hypothetical protein